VVQRATTSASRLLSASLDYVSERKRAHTQSDRTGSLRRPSRPSTRNLLSDRPQNERRTVAMAALYPPTLMGGAVKMNAASGQPPRPRHTPGAWKGTKLDETAARRAPPGTSKLKPISAAAMQERHGAEAGRGEANQNLLASGHAFRGEETLAVEATPGTALMAGTPMSGRAPGSTTTPSLPWLPSSISSSSSIGCLKTTTWPS